MKYIKIILITLLISIFLFGCDKDNDENILDIVDIPLSLGGEYNETGENRRSSYGQTFTQIGDSIMYTIYGGSQLANVTVNVNTGIVSHMCKDPMCNHSSCFWSLNTTFLFTSYKNRLYFIYYIMGGGSRILSTNQYGEDIITYCESENNIQCLEINEKYIFYSQRDGENYDNIYRLDLKTKEVKNMTPENKDSFNRPMFIIDDYFYFSDLINIYHTDFNFTNKEVIKEEIFQVNIQTDGKYMYYRTYTKTSSYDGEYTLRRMNLDGSDEKILQENVDTFFLTDDNIYFSYYERDIEAMQNGEVFDSIKGKIYKMDNNAENVELIADIPELFIVEYFIYGDYIYIITIDWENRQNNYTAGIYPNPYRVNIGGSEPPQELVYNP